MRRRLALSLVALAALGSASQASGHAFPTPTFVETGATTTVELSVPNERRQSMTALELVTPSGLVIAEATSGNGWTSSSTRQRAMWSGGELPTFAATTFVVELAVDHEPGTVVLRLVERYADGAQVRWPVALAVTPAADSSSRLGFVLLVGLAALLALTIGAAFLLRRRRSSLQER